MKQSNVRVILNEEVAKNTYKLVFEDNENKYLSGQFINIKIKDTFLRRPISISSIDGNLITIYYKVVGKGTELLTTYTNNDYLDILTPLGNNFEVVNNEDIVIVGGGIGIAPLYQLAKELVNNDNNVEVVLGFNSSDEMYLVEEFKSLGINVEVCCMDGSYGFSGNCIEYLDTISTKDKYVYACGPLIMLEQLEKYFNQGYISLEARMACGFGVCRGCMIKDENELKRICVEGPIFKLGEVDLHGLKC